MQWDEEINIGVSSISFAKFYQNLLVSISSNVENNNFKLESQNSIVNSLENIYDNLITEKEDNQKEIDALTEVETKILELLDLVDYKWNKYF